MNVFTIARFLNKELRVSSIKDDSKNGLQFNAKQDVKKIGFAVDACLEAFQKAKKEGCDLLVVHHGLFWKNQKYAHAVSERLAFLKKSKLSLYAAHLPLDLHPRYGNNRRLCDALAIGRSRRFAAYHGFPIGFKGTVKTQSLREFAERVERTLATNCKVLGFGPNRIRTVGVGSGGSGFALEEAMGKLDCFLVGEISHSAYHFAKESRLNVVIAGHYATETLGVKALADLLQAKFNIQTVFIDVPTGM